MCGFLGFWGERPLEHELRRVLNQLQHRGPDADGTYIENEAGFCLGHRRLSIIDLSPAGAQPMVSASGRYVLALNGEIYNFQELRLDLESRGVFFRGHSDTEVLLEAIEVWGLEKSLEKSTGMFALALWDRQEKALALARDRAGEKPLYYGWIKSGLLAFSSELKAIRAHRDFDARLDRKSISQFLRYSYIPEPRTIYEDFFKLTPGQILRFLAPEKMKVQKSSFWNFHEVIQRAKDRPFQGTLNEAMDELDQRLTLAVQNQMVADVPLGAFLSGGIDSSLVVAMMQKLSRQPVKTFTIGFESRDFDESEAARGVAKALGSDHTTLMVTSGEARDVIPKLASIYDEPFADSSQIPTYLVSKLARQSVTVSLSGDGGDEVFGGYNRYHLGAQVSGVLSRLPRALRCSVGACLERIRPAVWDRAFEVASLGPNPLIRQPGLKMQKLAAALRTNSQFELFEVLATIYPRPERVMAHGESDRRDQYIRTRLPEGLNFTEFMMAYDFLTYLVDDILTKVDRAAMAVSLETRVPFLDHHLIEFAWSLPLKFRVEGAKGKVILKSLLGRYLDPTLFERPKMGFGIPLAEWLRGPLRSWAESLIRTSKITDEGFFVPHELAQKWNEHISGRRDWSHALWNVLMFESWLESEKSKLKHHIRDINHDRGLQLVHESQI